MIISCFIKICSSDIDTQGTDSAPCSLYQIQEKGRTTMIENYVSPKSSTTAKRVLQFWLMQYGRDMEKTPVNAIILADLFPGFVDVAYLFKVWKELNEYA